MEKLAGVPNLFGSRETKAKRAIEKNIQAIEQRKYDFVIHEAITNGVAQRKASFYPLVDCI